MQIESNKDTDNNVPLAHFSNLRSRDLILSYSRSDHKKETEYGLFVSTVMPADGECVLSGNREINFVVDICVEYGGTQC